MEFWGVLLLNSCCAGELFACVTRVKIERKWLSMTSTPMFERAVVIGVGMMGGSLGIALRKHKLARQVVGVDQDKNAILQGRALEALDSGTTHLEEALEGADLIVLATPVLSIPPLLEQLATSARITPQALITDLGSTKQRIVTTGERLFASRFVGGHPMAGSPQGGVEASTPHLFEGAAWALVSSHEPDVASEPHVARLAALVTALGARPVYLDSRRHDQIVALVSHLPHLLSFAFAATVASFDEPDTARRMAGGSFRDMMRVSDADRTFWSAIFQENRSALLNALNSFEQEIARVREQLQSNGATDD